MSCQDIANQTGRHLLFLGTGTAEWSPDQFKHAAQFAKAHGIDSLLLKCADGGSWWYGGLAGYLAIRNIILAEGVGVIPYTYSYGNKFNALDAEISILQDLLNQSGHIACVDMEAEWNSQVAWAQHFCSKMQGHPGTLLVSTWADPSQQAWTGVLQALNPCVSSYLPQQYNNSLATYWQEFAASGAACLQPTVTMTQDFGPNDPVNIAKIAHDQGHTAISVWHFDTAAANPSLLDAIYAAFPKGAQSMVIELDTPGVSTFFAGTNNTIWQCIAPGPSKGLVIGHLILDFYRAHGGDALCGLTHLGLPLTNEVPVAGHPGVVEQQFERGRLRYDPEHLMEYPPKAGPVYTTHVGNTSPSQTIAAKLKAIGPQLSSVASEIGALGA